MTESSLCCIDSCGHAGVFRYKNRLYCRAHLTEEQNAQSVPPTEFECSLEGCHGRAVIMDGSTRKRFCSYHAWHATRATEIPLEGTMSEEPAKKTLDDWGRRYDHLNELKDVWEEGLYTISRIRPQYVSKADETLKQSLTVAVEMLTKQIDAMAAIDRHLFEVREQVDSK